MHPSIPGDSKPLAQPSYIPDYFPAAAAALSPESAVDLGGSGFLSRFGPASPVEREKSASRASDSLAASASESFVSIIERAHQIAIQVDALLEEGSVQNDAFSNPAHADDQNKALEAALHELSQHSYFHHSIDLDQLLPIFQKLLAIEPLTVQQVKDFLKENHFSLDQLKRIRKNFNSSTQRETCAAFEYLGRAAGIAPWQKLEFQGFARIWETINQAVAGLLCEDSQSVSSAIPERPTLTALADIKSESNYHKILRFVHADIASHNTFEVNLLGDMPQLTEMSQRMCADQLGLSHEQMQVVEGINEKGVRVHGALSAITILDVTRMNVSVEKKRAENPVLLVQALDKLCKGNRFLAFTVSKLLNQSAFAEPQIHFALHSGVEIDHRQVRFLGSSELFKKCEVAYLKDTQEIQIFYQLAGQTSKYKKSGEEAAKDSDPQSSPYQYQFVLNVKVPPIDVHQLEADNAIAERLLGELSECADDLKTKMAKQQEINAVMARRGYAVSKLVSLEQFRLKGTFVDAAWRPA